MNKNTDKIIEEKLRLAVGLREKRTSSASGLHAAPASICRDLAVASFQLAKLRIGLVEKKERRRIALLGIQDTLRSLDWAQNLLLEEYEIAVGVKTP